MYISFIAPTYNVDKYLDDFFSSFLPLKDVVDFEIIMVNDEPDKSLKRWVDKFYQLNIRILNNTKNIGQGPSRIKGAKFISDKTTNIIFIDPDDRIGNISFVDHLSENDVIQFAKNRWFINKRIYEKADGNVTKYNLDNVIHGISFPVHILKDFGKYTRENESNDMPIKIRMAEDFPFKKSDRVMIDYRIRKSSTINTKRSERRAQEEINTWEHLVEEGFIEAGIGLNNMYFETIINKKSFSKEWYTKKKNELRKKVGWVVKFSAYMYRATSFWRLKNFVINLLTNRKMFE